MKISSELRDLISFTERELVPPYSEIRTKICPTEVGVDDSSPGSQLVEQGLAYYEWRINPKIVKDTSSKEKIRIYVILRVLSCYFEHDGLLNFLLEDYVNLLKRRGYADPRYSYLRSLTDNFFLYEIDSMFWKGNQKRRRASYRAYLSVYTKNYLTLKEVFLKYFDLSRPIVIKKKRPTKKEFRKGYRDHGTLGTENSALIKDIRSDAFLREEEEKYQKRKRDLRDFLLGATE